MLRLAFCFSYRCVASCCFAIVIQMTLVTLCYIEYPHRRGPRMTSLSVSFHVPRVLHSFRFIPVHVAFLSCYFSSKGTQTGHAGTVPSQASACYFESVTLHAEGSFPLDISLHFALISFPFASSSFHFAFISFHFPSMLRAFPLNFLPRWYLLVMARGPRCRLALRKCVFRAAFHLSLRQCLHLLQWCNCRCWGGKVEWRWDSDADSWWKSGARGLIVGFASWLALPWQPGCLLLSEGWSLQTNCTCDVSDCRECGERRLVGITDIVSKCG